MFQIQKLYKNFNWLSDVKRVKFINNFYVVAEIVN